jgi:Ras-related protein Rab-22
MDTSPLQVKIVLLGDSGVGKSSIVLRYVTDNFKTDEDGTVGGSYMGKIVNMNEKMVKINIWDTAGQERYHSLAKMYYRDANAAILVYDVTNHDSFDGMIRWYNEVRQNSQANIAIAVAGNKEDLVDQETTAYEQAFEFAESINAIYKKTSAKSNFGIEQLFKEILISIYPDLNQPKQAKKSVMLDSKVDKKIKKKNCC